MNKFLYKLYFQSPGRFKRILLKIIVRQEGYMYSNTLREIYKRAYNIIIGYGSYGGCFNTSNVPAGVTFGNYCSIAPNIKIFRANHPMDTFTSHPLLYNPVAGFVKKDKLTRPKLVIGHDVWIGEGTIILPNVMTIGNGAIIGAGSIVTKDVGAYSIVAGNPAKEKGKRFDQSIIKELEDSEWWNLERDDLIKKIPDLNEITQGKNSINKQASV